MRFSLYRNSISYQLRLTAIYRLRGGAQNCVLLTWGYMCAIAHLRLTAWGRKQSLLLVGLYTANGDALASVALRLCLKNPQGTMPLDPSLLTIQVCTNTLRYDPAERWSNGTLALSWESRRRYQRALQRRCLGQRCLSLRLDTERVKRRL